MIKSLAHETNYICMYTMNAHFQESVILMCVQMNIRVYKKNSPRGILSTHN
jgi:hypothetical protein